MRKLTSDILFDEISLMGIPALFTDWRIDRSSVPVGMFLYEVRHTDEDWGEPCQLARSIFVNFYGSILTTMPFDLSSSVYLDFDSKDFVYAAENPCTTTEFLRKYAHDRKEPI